MASAPTASLSRLRQRLPLLVLGFVGLAGGLYVGLARIGAVEGGIFPPALHGPLMVSGFFGTVIGLERAVALARLWAYAGPLASGLGTLALLGGAPDPAPQILFLVAGLVMSAGALIVLRLQTTLHAIVLLLGALAWIGATLLWLRGLPMPVLALWWMAFLVLTIAGERLELSRFLGHGPSVRRLFALAATLYLVGLAVAAISEGGEIRIVGAGLLAIALWLGRFDLARRTVRQAGQVRFTAFCLLAGYVWLAVAGAALMIEGDALIGYRYDAILHAVFLGFVFSMVFAHAPIILPAILGLAVPYRPVFYVHVALLHASVLFRLAADATETTALRPVAAWANLAAVVLFIVMTARAVREGTLARRAGGSKP